MWFSQVGSGLTRKHLTWLEKGEHAGLLQTFVNYGREKFYNIEPWCQRHAKLLFSPSSAPKQSKLECLYYPGNVFQYSPIFVVKKKPTRVEHVPLWLVSYL